MDLFFETSAKSGLNVQNILIDAAKILYLEYMNYVNFKSNISDKNNIVIVKKNNEDQRKKMCCI